MRVEEEADFARGVRKVLREAQGRVRSGVRALGCADRRVGAMFFAKFMVVEGCLIIAVFYRNWVRALFLCSEKRKLRAIMCVLLESAREMLKRAEELSAGG